MPGLLIVTYHFPPSAASGAFRLLGFARHLPAHGVPVSVVAPPTLPWEPSDAGLAARVPPGTALYPVPYPSGAPDQRVASQVGSTRANTVIGYTRPTLSWLAIIAPSVAGIDG